MEMTTEESNSSCSLVASSGDDLKFHSYPTGRLAHMYKCSTTRWETGIRTISWSKEGSWLVLVPSKGLAEVVTLKDHLRYLHTIHDVQQPTCACFQNLSKKIISLGTLNGQMVLYDMKAKATRKRFPRACGPLKQLEFMSNDAHIIGSCETGEILLYTCVSGSLSASYTIPKSTCVTSIKSHPTKKSIFAAGSKEGIVALWDSTYTAIKTSISIHSAEVTGLVFCPLREELLVTVGADKQCCFMDMLNGKTVLEFEEEVMPTSVDFSGDGVSLVLGRGDGKMKFYDIRFMKNAQMVIDAHQTAVKNVAYQKGMFDKKEVDLLKEPNLCVFYNPCPEVQSKENTTYPKVSEEVSRACDVKSFLATLGIDNINSLTKNDTKTTISSSNFTNTLTQDLNKQEDLLINIPPPAEMTCNHLDITPESYSPPTVSNTTVKPISSTKRLSQNLQEGDKKVEEIPGLDMEKIRQILKDEIRAEFQNVKTELRSELMDIYAYIRRQFMDMQLSMVKEFVQLDDFLNKLREDLTVDDTSEDEFMFQENLRLRQQVAILSEKLKEKCEPRNEM